MVKSITIFYKNNSSSKSLFYFTCASHDFRFAVILAFDVKVERDAQELADNLGVKIFTADIIYHLFDKFMSYREVSFHYSVLKISGPMVKPVRKFGRVT